ncbi:hypothetical protein ACFU7T_26755 [Streptomyces sp. NPDC057555]|uniref:hypothetical protein n=1 Tax=Streptomyces sp. NPDC057555 TaxID=3346166 RepID=UPI0036C12D8F
MTRLISRTRSNLRTFFAPRGRHRAKPSSHLTHRACRTHPTPPAPPARTTLTPSHRPASHPADTPIGGRAALRVRPYLLAHGTGAVR